MIARVWRGWATPAKADDYQRHYRTAVAEHLRSVPGFVEARLLRTDDGGDVLFTSVVVFTDLESVHAFAGAEPRVAVVEEAARAALVRWDEYVTHHDVAVDVA
ncbi:antibiotic biosynthesis monooxygenase family protein [Cryptosporangium minutisporangium]|uniref:Antibiotic biosynthesis monooxygenase n=1 Tax=Cryptosporangium minutisporangium TaxID=113569 RepID=A0ABP6SZP6_9ACTN